LHVEESRSPIEEKRHHRFTAADGPLCLRYWATIELSLHIQPAENVPETPPGALPADVVPYPYPSRYCESDKLARLARHEFGRLQPGFSRVTAICNWIHDNVEYCAAALTPHFPLSIPRPSALASARFCSSRNCFLPSDGDPCAICNGLRIRARTAGFPRVL